MFADPKIIPSYIVREERITVDLPAIITTFEGQPMEARIKNISTGGFFAVCRRAIPIRSQIVIFSPIVGRRSAEVRWALGKRIGAAFNGLPTGRLSDRECDGFVRYALPLAVPLWEE